MVIDVALESLIVFAASGGASWAAVKLELRAMRREIKGQHERIEMLEELNCNRGRKFYEMAY